MTHRDPSLKFVCPVCEASPKEQCHVNDRVICFESHMERRELALNVITGSVQVSSDAPVPRKWHAS
jgi:hypothetical protein